MSNDLKMRWALLVVGSSLFALLPLFLHASEKYPVDGPFLRSAQAPIDEAFESVTSRHNIQDASVDWKKNMPAGFQAKRNSSYPWGTTTYGESELWVGTKVNKTWRESITLSALVKKFNAFGPSVSETSANYWEADVWLKWEF